MPHFLTLVAPRETTGPAEPVQALYLLSGAELCAPDVARLTAELLHDPVVQTAHWLPLTESDLAADPLLPAAGHAVEVAYRPGVTDNEAESIREGARHLGIAALSAARSLRRHLLPAAADPHARAALLANDLVQTSLVYGPGAHSAPRLAFYEALIAPPPEAAPQIARVPLRAADDAELLRISKAGVLALDLAEMQAIRAYFARIGRDPSDGELETLAQTWSEHCSHKTFKAKVRYREEKGAGAQGDQGPDATLYPMLALLGQGELEINSLIKTFLMVATEQVLAARSPAPDWVLSAFVDNAGIIAFTDDYEVSIKVETHNHPSALEPFGGANTGVGGVIRDVMGVSARPIANIDVLCFGMPTATPDSPGVIPPARICTGVVAGVRDYGNKLGIPTVNGAVLFDPGYTANPLVYCGTVGIAPRGAHPRNVQPGDAVVVLGGRTGRDGIHGATFSSIELTHDTAATVGSAVQIGDPITEKKTLDVLLQARDQGLYSAITDCGAGGLSSAVGEMGAETGVAVELDSVPRKYAGLQPWEVWLSEAQERMVLAVPPASLTAFLALCAAEDVEATAIGTFTADKHLRVTHAGASLVDIDMDFLHDGRPQRVLEAFWAKETRGQGAKGPRGIGEAGEQIPLSLPPPVPLSDLLLRLLAHPNIASKERIIRTYDHEVGGATVIKPLVGAQMDGPGDAAVLQPLPGTPQGLALGCGVNPGYGRIDPYWMALAAVDEALRNVVAVGGDPARTVILDNFCWGDPRQPDRMAGLVRASAGCYDAAVAFGTPFVSGKDSLNNEYRDASGARVAIPPTLLITALAHVPDVARCVTMDLKEPGNQLYLVGATRAELAGGHLLMVASPPSLVGLGADRPPWTEGHVPDHAAGAPPISSQTEGHVPDHAAGVSPLSRTRERGTGGEGYSPQPPHVDLAAARAAFAALHGAIASGLVRACHDLSEGGLAVAAAEMAMAGGLGLALDLAPIALAEADLPAALLKLFSETTSRFLVEVRPADAAAFAAAMRGTPITPLGAVIEPPALQIRDGDAELLRLDLATLKAAWQSGLDGIDL